MSFAYKLSKFPFSQVEQEYQKAAFLLCCQFHSLQETEADSSKMFLFQKASHRAKSKREKLLFSKGQKREEEIFINSL